jgi:hypothetical protein
LVLFLLADNLLVNYHFQLTFVVAASSTIARQPNDDNKHADDDDDDVYIERLDASRQHRYAH